MPGVRRANRASRKGLTRRQQLRLLDVRIRKRGHLQAPEWVANQDREYGPNRRRCWLTCLRPGGTSPIGVPRQALCPRSFRHTVHISDSGTTASGVRDRTALVRERCTALVLGRIQCT
jgi:hypothetical protein